MSGRVLMVQGTASHVGKSVLVAALCRIFRDRGLSVAPFKAQNMSLNSFVTPDGGEIGRAQAVQAEAAGIPPTVEMNPVLLKPEAHSRSQVVLMGRPHTTVSAADYYTLKPQLWGVVTSALDTLRSRHDIVVIEGAGSPAEVNFASVEIVNMSVARYCRAPVMLVGDIDRGGVFASLLGTLWLLEPGDLSLVKALVINKFRGDRRLLAPGITFLTAKAGIPVAGVIPMFNDIHIAQEDSVSLDNRSAVGAGHGLDIAVVRLPHISNFDDFDPLGADVRYVSSPADLGDPDLVILPGSKTTVADLDWLQDTGLAERIRGLHTQGAYIIGICGGYQMLGEGIDDPGLVESEAAYRSGLRLLPVRTVFSAVKATHQVRGAVAGTAGLLSGARGLPLAGYEIHMGTTERTGGVFRITERSGLPCDRYDGCQDSTGRCLGTYIHGLFHNDGLRTAILSHIAAARGRPVAFDSDARQRDPEYDKLADLVRRSLDMDLVYAMVGLGQG